MIKIRFIDYTHDFVCEELLPIVSVGVIICPCHNTAAGLADHCKWKGSEKEPLNNSFTSTLTFAGSRRPHETNSLRANFFQK